MRRVDREALERALRMAAADPVERQWLAEKRRTEGWEEAALTAAYHFQVKTLNLRPWQDPPMWASDERPRDDDRPHAGKLAAWQLRRQLLAAGLSEFEPDPVAALEAVSACQRNGAGKPSARPSDLRLREDVLVTEPELGDH